MRVSVYADCESVRLELNGREIATGPNKNIRLGRLREATGTNGKPLTQMQGNFIRIVVIHKPHPKDPEVVLDEIASFGEPSLRRVYGDWSSQALGQWKEQARDLGLDSNGPLYDPVVNYDRVRDIVWDWQQDPAPVAQSTRTVDIPAQDGEISTAP